MTLTTGGLSAEFIVWLGGTIVVTAAIIVAIRHYLLPRRPLVASVAAAIALVVAGLNLPQAGIQAGGVSLALVPAIAVIAAARRPLSPDTWLLAATTLTVALTVLAILIHSLAVALAGAAASGVLSYLVALRSDDEN